MSAEARYQVFVSSTYADLITERQAVMSALLQLGALPAGMELFPAADDEAWILIERVIDESDYYLLVVGGRYGSIDSDGLSYTEREYEYATSLRKPVMAFLHQDPGKLPFESSEGDPVAREKLASFRKKVQAAKHVKYWTSAEDLAGKIALSFATFTRSYPSVGWVRGDAGDSPETLLKLTKAQERVTELENRLHDRTVEPPATAKGLADRDERLRFDANVLLSLSHVPYTSGIKTEQSMSIEASISWNEILSALGLAMINEVSQDELSKRFAKAVARINMSDGEQLALKSLRSQIKDGALNDKEREKIRYRSKVVSGEEVFETALLQLEALGLIEKGSKKRPVSDTATYWTLTPWGRTRLMALRAVRAGSSRPPEKDDADSLSAEEVRVDETVLSRAFEVGPDGVVSRLSGRSSLPFDPPLSFCSPSTARACLCSLALLSRPKQFPQLVQRSFMHVSRTLRAGLGPVGLASRRCALESVSM